jgi:hypothetical protein
MCIVVITRNLAISLELDERGHSYYGATYDSTGVFLILNLEFSRLSLITHSTGPTRTWTAVTSRTKLYQSVHWFNVSQDNAV